MPDADRPANGGSGGVPGMTVEDECAAKGSVRCWTSRMPNNKTEKLENAVTSHVVGMLCNKLCTAEASTRRWTLRCWSPGIAVEREWTVSQR